MVSCSELEDEDDEQDVQTNVQEASSPSIDDKVLAVLDILTMLEKNLPEEMHKQVVVALYHAK